MKFISLTLQSILKHTQRQKYIYVATVNCFFFPLGTLMMEKRKSPRMKAVVNAVIMVNNVSRKGT